MAEIDIDISRHRSKSIDEFREDKFDYVVTVCEKAKEGCPFFPYGNMQLHKGFFDPALAKGNEEEIVNVFRQVRDAIKDWIKEEFGKKDIKK